MIEPESASRWRTEARFDRVATTLIGLIAVLAAVLAILQTGYGQESTRAAVQAGRLATDAAARISASSLARDSALRAQQDAIVLAMGGVGRMLAATKAGDADAYAVGAAQQAASDRLRAALTESAATTGGSPLDSYTAGLVTASIEAIKAEVAEQGRQVDLANDAGGRELRAVLGLSLLALAAVLAGIAAVLREGRAGWISLLVAWGVAVTAATVAILTVA